MIYLVLKKVSSKVLLTLSSASRRAYKGFSSIFCFESVNSVIGNLVSILFLTARSSSSKLNKWLLNVSNFVYFSTEFYRFSNKFRGVRVSILFFISVNSSIFVNEKIYELISNSSFFILTSLSAKVSSLICYENLVFYISDLSFSISDMLTNYIASNA